MEKTHQTESHSTEFLKWLNSIIAIFLIIEKGAKVIVSLYEMFCTDTLRHRDSARKIIEKLSEIPKTDIVVIDFAKIDFASRSFLHELLVGLSDRNILFQNESEEVETMKGIISKGIESPFGSKSEKCHFTTPYIHKG